MGNSSENANDFRKQYIQVIYISQKPSKYPRWRTSWVTLKPTNHYADADLCFHVNATNWLYPKLQSRQFNGTNYFHHNQIMAPEGRSILEAACASSTVKKTKKFIAKPPQNYKSLAQRPIHWKITASTLFTKAHIAFPKVRKK